MKKLIVIALPILFFGCAGYETQAQRQQKTISYNIQASNSNYNTCMDHVVRKTEEMKRLESKYIMSTDDNKKFEKYMNNEYATGADRDDFVFTRSKMEECRAQQLKEMSWVDARHADVYREYYLNSDDNLLSLLNNKITVGEYNKNVVALIEKHNSSLSNVETRINSDLSKNHYAEVQMRQQQAQQVQQNLMEQQRINLQQQQMLNNNIYNKQSRTTNTNCYFIGNNLNCTTR